MQRNKVIKRAEYSGDREGEPKIVIERVGDRMNYGRSRPDGKGLVRGQVTWKKNLLFLLPLVMKKRKILNEIPKLQRGSSLRLNIFVKKSSLVEEKGKKGRD